MVEASVIMYYNEMDAPRYMYYVVRYVADIRSDVGIDFAILAFSELQPKFLDLKQVPSWAPVLESDPDAEIDLLNEFLNELPAKIRTDPRYIERLLQWENSIRILPPMLFRTRDFAGTFSLLADAELVG